jgi:hypothetical protein
VKSSFPNLHPKEKPLAKQARQLREILLSIFMVLAAIGISIAFFLWTVCDFTGEYAGISPRLGMVRLSLGRQSGVLKGRLNYGHGTPLYLVTTRSVSPDDINLVFQISGEATRLERVRQVNLRGKYDDSAIVAIVIDSGTPYPVSLRRNNLYSMILRILYLLGKQPDND